MTNMGNTHTCTVGRVDVLLAVIGLLHVQLVELAREMISRSCVHDPCRIDRIGRCMPLRLMEDMVRHGELTVQEAAIIANTKKALVEALEAS